MVHGLDHVGVVVEDLGATGAAFERLLGVVPEYLSVPEVGLEALVFPFGGSAVEVIRFSAGPFPGIDPRVFRPGPGLQHLAFRVPDLEAARRRLACAGVEILRGFPRRGLHGPILFFAEPVTGVLLELIEAPDFPARWGPA